jgi:hypothetical protein
MYLNVAPEVLRAGLSAAVLVARDLGDARQSPALVAYRRQAAQQLAARWKNRSVSSDGVLAEHRRLAGGESTATERLLGGVRRQRDLPAGSALADCCNIVAGRTLLCVRAVAAPKPDSLSLRADGSYEGSGGQAPAELPERATEALVLLHGNRLLPAATLLKGAWLLAELLETLCGSHAELVDFFEGQATGEPPAPAPAMSFETFQRLALCKGTVLAASAHPSLSGLAVVALRAASETRALAPASVLAQQLVGAAVLAATGLHPLTVGGERHSDYLLTVRGPSGAEPLRVEAHGSIPDGARLY